MKTFLKIFKYQINDIIRGKWVFFYGLFFYIVSESLLRFGNNSSQAIVGLLNVTLILIPIVSLIFGSIYVYNSREFIELILCLPINRVSLFFGMFLSLSISLSTIFIIGTGIPLLIHSYYEQSAFITLLTSGVLLTFIFSSIAVTLSLIFDDKSKGIGVALIVWILTSVLYDGFIILFIKQFSDFPLEGPIIGISILNPVDMARILVMLKFDAAALMGYTGATFEKFFGSITGSVLSVTALILWSVIPLMYGLKKFNKKNF